LGNASSSSNQQPVVDGASVRMEYRCRTAADVMVRFDNVENGVGLGRIVRKKDGQTVVRCGDVGDVCFADVWT